MTRMLPPEPRTDSQSKAERWLFDVIRTELPDDQWTALHSVGITSHDYKPWAQIDFVMVGPDGVFCLEVKGGRVSRKDGLWHFVDGNGNETIKDHGPFEQVAPAAAALYKHLAARMPSIRTSPVGYGVVIPDVRFDLPNPDFDPQLVYDARDRDNEFDTYVQRITSYWRNRIADMYGHQPAVLSAEDRTAIVNVLRGDFDYRPSLRTKIGGVQRELLRLTEEQYGRLDDLRENDRVIVKGGAGTGKTLLAVEEAKRAAKSGRSVFLCCFNRLLASSIRGILREYSGIDVWSIHSYMAAITAEAGLHGSLPNAEEDDLFQVFYPEKCIEGLIALDRYQTYDCLIIDETQDLMQEAYLDVLDSVVVGGIEHGIWKAFLDPFQNIFGGSSSVAMRKLLIGHPAQYRLSTNCRNTKPIGVATRIISGVGCDDTLKIEGPEVSYVWYRDYRHERIEVSNLVKRLLSQGVLPEEIVILSRYKIENSCLSGGLLGVHYPLRTLAGDELAEEGSIRYTTVSSFKGLEAEVVLLVDIDNIRDDDALMSAYVGASRARACLGLFIDTRLQPDYADKAVAYGQAMAEAMRRRESI